MTEVSIPEFPESRKITLSDRGRLEDVFRRYPSEISERTFGSIYIWRNYEDRSELSMLNGHLVISWFRAKFGRTVLPPVGPDQTAAVDSLFGHPGFSEKGFSGIFGLTEPEVFRLRALGRTPESLRDEWDYVYRTEDLAGLKGPKYHTQRKELSKATSQFKIDFEPMTPAHRDACLELEETWCDVKHCTLDKFSAAEDAALKEALESMTEIGFFGGVATINGKIHALTLGERLDEKTAIVHFEKADPSIRGMYQFINQQFCMHSLKGFEFVNREQDVGEPGLRRAKEGYHPHHFVEKHILLRDR